MKAERARPTLAPGGAPAVGAAPSTALDVAGPAADLRSAERRLEIRQGVVYCLEVFVGVRVGLFLLGLLGVGLIPGLRSVSVPGWRAHPIPDPGWQNLFTAWERFDALWFLRIAATGYRSSDGSAAFFPLYPLAVRAVSWVIGGHPFAAGLIVSNLSFLGALWVLYFLTASELSAGAARKAVLYLALFPTSFFFFAPYSESLFLFLAVASFWAARRDRWELAGILGALAALTRSVGLIIAPALAVEAIHQRREGRGSLPPRLAWSAFVGVGTFAYLAYWWRRTGDWLAPVHQQVNWERVRVAPWSTLTRGTEAAFRYPGQYPGGYWLLDWLIVVPVLLAAVYVLFRFRPAYGVFVWAGLLAPLSFVFQPRPLLSMPRFVLPLFPVVWALADAAERRRIPHQAVAVVGAAGLGLLTVLFVNWYYIF